MRLRAEVLAVGIGLALLALAASAQQQRLRPLARFVRSPLIQSRALAIDLKGAGVEAKGAPTQRGRRINLRFIAANQALIDQTTIPVLLPSEPPLARNLMIFPNGAHYAISSHSGGMSFHLTGHGRAFDLAPAAVRRLPRADFRARIPADGVVIEHSESGIDASFNRFGAAYSISLECADPADRRCNDEMFVRGLIQRLMVVIPGASQ